MTPARNDQKIIRMWIYLGDIEQQFKHEPVFNLHLKPFVMFKATVISFLGTDLTTSCTKRAQRERIMTKYALKSQIS